MVTRKAIDPHPASRLSSKLQEPVLTHDETHFRCLNGLIAPTLHPIGNIPPDRNGLNVPDQVESSSTQAQMRGLPSTRGTSAAENCAYAPSQAHHTQKPAAPSQGRRASSVRGTGVTPQRAHALSAHARCSLNPYGHVLRLPVAHDRHGDGVAGLVAAHVADQLLGAGHFLAFDLDDDVAGADARRGGTGTC